MTKKYIVVKNQHDEYGVIIEGGLDCGVIGRNSNWTQQEAQQHADKYNAEIGDVWTPVDPTAKPE